MSTGGQRIAGTIDLLESNPEVAPTGTTRIARIGGSLKSSTDGGSFAGLGGGGTSDGVTITGDGSGGNPFASIPASATNAGSMSTSNFKKARDYDTDSWFTTQVETMRANFPNLTKFREVMITNLAQGVLLGSLANDGAVVGGAAAPATNTALAFTRSVFQTPKTTQWAIGFRAIFATVSGTTYNICGYTKVDNSHDVGFGVVNGINSGNTYGIQINGPATTNIDTGVTSDGLVHDFILGSNATNVLAWIDGTQRVSNGALTNLVDEANYLYAYTHANPNTKILRLCYGFIAP